MTTREIETMGGENEGVSDGKNRIHEYTADVITLNKNREKHKDCK